MSKRKSTVEKETAGKIKKVERENGDTSRESHDKNERTTFLQNERIGLNLDG